MLYPEGLVEGAVIVVCFKMPDPSPYLFLGVNEKGKGLGLPGGKIDPGETALQAALRELQEETGIIPKEGIEVMKLPTQLCSSDPFCKESVVFSFLAKAEDFDFTKVLPEAKFLPLEYFIDKQTRFPEFNEWLLRDIIIEGNKNYEVIG